MEFQLTDAHLVPHLDQYFGTWAMSERHFLALAEQATRVDIRVHMQEQSAKEAKAEIEARDGEPSKSFQFDEGLAVIELNGSLMKHASSFSGGTSTIKARQKLRAARKDSDVRGVMIKIDSPGGTVAGTKELADEVSALAESKPTHAFIEDLGASAAFWVASQASHISANQTGLVGSIGTFGVVVDSSAMAAANGIKVHVIRAGEFKGVGTPGTEVTAEQLDHHQEIINELNELFLTAVSTGRGMPIDQIRLIADGRAHVAKTAQAMGLVDQVETFEQAMSALDAVATLNTRNPRMSAATYEEIKSECAGANAEFIVGELDQKSTVEESRQNWMASQQLELEQTSAKLAKALEANKTTPPAATSRRGVEPVSSTDGRRDKTTPGGTGSARQEFANLVGQRMSDRGVARHEAHKQICREFPDLRIDMGNEENEALGRPPLT